MELTTIAKSLDFDFPKLMLSRDWLHPTQRNSAVGKLVEGTIPGGRCFMAESLADKPQFSGKSLFSHSGTLAEVSMKVC